MSHATGSSSARSQSTRSRGRWWNADGTQKPYHELSLDEADCLLAEAAIAGAELRVKLGL